jgi:predicted HicB family RNase H-like nuclease
MPRKRSMEGKPVNATGTVLKAVRLELTPETHKQLRIEAAKQDMSMAALVRGLVEEYLKKLGSGKGSK